MEDLETKYVTEIAQIRRIIGGNSELTLFLLRECAEDVGLVSVSEYCELLPVKKRTLQDRLKRGSVKYIEISGLRFPCINI